MAAVVRVLDRAEHASLAPSLRALLVEFTPSAAALSDEVVLERLSSPMVRVVVAELDGALVGAATLCLSATLTSGVIGQVEDVIVTEAARGQRLGRLLMDELHAEARRQGCRYLQLTSRPSREAANRLYVSLGYARRETNVYRLALD